MAFFEGKMEKPETMETGGKEGAGFEQSALDKYDQILGDDKLEEVMDGGKETQSSQAVSDLEVNTADVGEQKDVENNYYSTYKERLDRTPGEDGERGEWSGERGESDFTPNDEDIRDILDKYDRENIAYEDAIPDFSEVAEATVKIDDMTENRADNFRQCDEQCAKQWNQEEYNGKIDWFARDVKDWRQENGYSWHERNDMRTCDLVPTQVNTYFGHLGGVSECKKRDAGNGGSDFDE